jgi:hypothetical protein
MTDWKISEITKQEAGLRQLDQAIRAFFRRDDMLGVHTLAAAAMGLLSDLGKLKGVASPFRDSQEWLAALKKTQNFLKHADQDPTSVHLYNEKETVFLLFESVGLAGALVNETSRDRHAFFTWFVMSFPDLLEPQYAEVLRAGADRHGVDPTNRDLWYRWLTER